MRESGPSGPGLGLGSSGIGGGYGSNCPLCDSSVFEYCSHKLLHDACCCNGGWTTFQGIDFKLALMRIVFLQESVSHITVELAIALIYIRTHVMNIL